MNLPPPGYPISEQAITDWFRTTYRREPVEREIGLIMDAMADRSATPPHEGPPANDRGWSFGPPSAEPDRS
ncbi:MAG: hypothetical protein JO227_13445 [Acetobacteraceae bacterium]|nr:hypothetical protein [Acetobacteraceae bacterium]